MQLFSKEIQSFSKKYKSFREEIKLISEENSAKLERKCTSVGEALNQDEI